MEGGLIYNKNYRTDPNYNFITFMCNININVWELVEDDMIKLVQQIICCNHSKNLFKVYMGLSQEFITNCEWFETIQVKIRICSEYYIKTLKELMTNKGLDYFRSEQDFNNGIPTKEIKRTLPKSQYIYLLRKAKYVETNQNIYKVGRTKRKHLDRFKEYPKGSCLLFQRICNDCEIAEREIIKLFKKKYEFKKTLGNESFEGNCEEMMVDIQNTIIRLDKNSITYINANKEYDIDLKSFDFGKINDLQGYKPNSINNSSPINNHEREMDSDKISSNGKTLDIKKSSITSIDKIIEIFNNVLDLYYSRCVCKKYPNSMRLSPLYELIMKDKDKDNIKKFIDMIGNFSNPATLTRQIHIFLTYHNTKYEIRKNGPDTLRDNDKTAIVFKKES